MFTEDIQQLRTVPKTPVVFREILVVSPGKTWQYFRISDDRIVVVRCDGQQVMQEEMLILEKNRYGQLPRSLKAGVRIFLANLTVMFS